MQEYYAHVNGFLICISYSANVGLIGTIQGPPPPSISLTCVTYIIKFVLVVRYPKPLPSYLNLFAPFSPGLWAIIGATYVIIEVIIRLTNWKKKHIAEDGSGFRVLPAFRLLVAQGKFMGKPI